jgi:putative transposase
MSEATIKTYIEDQIKHDIALDKLRIEEYEDPFEGGK